MNIDNCSALITGASAGIGREFARQLASRSRTLVLVARREQRLNELRDELRNLNAQLQVHTRVVDLCETTQIDELVRWLEQNKIEIDFLINNAGLGDYGSIATSDPERDDRIIQVNVTALSLLTSPSASANDRKKTRCDFECELIGRFSPDSWHGCLRSDQSVRE